MTVLLTWGDWLTSSGFGGTTAPLTWSCLAMKLAPMSVSPHSPPSPRLKVSTPTSWTSSTESTVSSWRPRRRAHWKEADSPHRLEEYEEDADGLDRS